jgi:hypothetical protein
MWSDVDEAFQRMQEMGVTDDMTAAEAAQLVKDKGGIVLIKQKYVNLLCRFIYIHSMGHFSGLKPDFTDIGTIDSLDAKVSLLLVTWVGYSFGDIEPFSNEAKILGSIRQHKQDWDGVHGGTIFLYKGKAKGSDFTEVEITFKDAVAFMSICDIPPEDGSIKVNTNTMSLMITRLLRFPLLRQIISRPILRLLNFL